MLKTYSIPMAKFMLKPHFIPTELVILKDSHAFQLTCGVFQHFEHWEQLQRQYCTDSLGVPGKLAEHSSKSNSPPVLRIIFGCLHCQRSRRLWQENRAASLKSLPDVQCNQLHPSYHYTRWPVQLAASLLSLLGAWCNQLHPSYHYQVAGATSSIPLIIIRCFSDVLELSDPPSPPTSLSRLPSH